MRVPDDPKWDNDSYFWQREWTNAIPFSDEVTSIAESLYYDGWVRSNVHGVNQPYNELTLELLIELTRIDEDRLYESFKNSEFKLKIGSLAFLYARNPRFLKEIELPAYGAYIVYLLDDLYELPLEQYSEFTWTAMVHVKLGKNSTESLSIIKESITHQLTFDATRPYMEQGLTDMAFIASCIKNDVDPTLANSFYVPPVVTEIPRRKRRERNK